MKAKIVNVMEENWDYLIILDACRYDYISSMYKNYFLGQLEKRTSLGSCTPEWVQRSFPNYYPDVIYISGNPYINSKIKIAWFDAKRHFYKVVDVWDFGWSEELGTVPPEKVNEATLSFTHKFPEKRFIVHYLQPHAPYISSNFQTKGFPAPNPKHKRVLTGMQGYRVNRTVETIVNHIGSLLVRTRLIKNVWELREMINLPPASPMDAVRRKYGINGLREAYKENLKIVLEHVAELCNELLRREPSRSIAITSDHGELLGERGTYSHGSGYRDQILIEVPWLTVTNVKGTVRRIKSSKKRKLKEKIERLKNSGRV